MLKVRSTAWELSSVVLKGQLPGSPTYGKLQMFCSLLFKNEPRVTWGIKVRAGKIVRDRLLCLT